MGPHICTEVFSDVLTIGSGLCPPSQKDKQCKSTDTFIWKKTKDEYMELVQGWRMEDGTNTSVSWSWPVKDEQPKATRSFLLLAIKDGKYVGSMEGGKKWANMPNASPNPMYSVVVTSFSGLKPGITVAAVIMSIVSIAILLGYFAFEQLVVAKRE